MTPKKLAEIWCAEAALGGFKPLWWKPSLGAHHGFPSDAPKRRSCSVKGAGGEMRQAMRLFRPLCFGAPVGLRSEGSASFSRGALPRQIAEVDHRV
jgi:hypothetical protein